MSVQRAKNFEKVCKWVGPTVQPIEALEGWPGRAKLVGFGPERRLALHVSLVGPHSRAAHEFRFQNPADKALPVAAPNGALPVLVGIAKHGGQNILVVADGTSRLGRTTRFSILFDIGIVVQASISGWSEYLSSSGERIVAMRPPLLPAYVDAIANHVVLDPATVEDMAAASGLLDEQDDESVERTRIAVSRLVRRAAFGKDVCDAYENRCAMCGISLGLLEGAHIYPASAPGSSDKVWNGLALCRNHHRLFDRHRIWVSADDHRIVWHPEVLANGLVEPIAANLVQNTRPHIALPTKPAHRPRKAMFDQRYELAKSQYEWAA